GGYVASIWLGTPQHGLLAAFAARAARGGNLAPAVRGRGAGWRPGFDLPRTGARAGEVFPAAASLAQKFGGVEPGARSSSGLALGGKQSFSLAPAPGRRLRAHHRKLRSPVEPGVDRNRSRSADLLHPGIRSPSAPVSGPVGAGDRKPDPAS